jgi:hypothetical protein
MALCYLQAICAKVPTVVGKKMGLGVQVKPLCHIWHPQDTPHAFMTLLCVTVAAVHSNEQIPCLITKLAKTPFHNHNIQLQSLIVASVQLSHISPLFISTTHHNNPLIALPVCKQTLSQSRVLHMRYSTNYAHLGESSRWHSVILKQFVPRSPRL